MILGANGSGKTKLIDRIRHNAVQQRKKIIADVGNRRTRRQNTLRQHGRAPKADAVPEAIAHARIPVYVEGGRVAKPPGQVKVVPDAGQFENERNRYDRSLVSGLSARINHAFNMLGVTYGLNLLKYGTLAALAVANDQRDNIPEPPADPLRDLFEMFNQVFPEVKISLENDQGKLACTKAGEHYDPSQLSDGERQVLVLLADLVFTAKDDSLILVDEPELNLNPLLACRVWEVIEERWPDCVFIYATHCISFAMRPQVDTLLVIGADRKVERIESLDEIPQTQQRELLGAIPSVLSASRAVVVEGEDASFDLPLYEWLVGDAAMKIVPVGSCGNVVTAARREDVWSSIAANVAIVGVVDRDFRPDAYLEAVSGEGIVVLPVHEVESLLCYPEIVVVAAQKLGVAGLDQAAVENVILECFDRQKLRVAATRTCESLRLPNGLGVPSNVWARNPDSDAISSILVQNAAALRGDVTNALDDDRVRTAFQTELTACDDAIAKRDIEKILALGPGKPTLSEIATKLGLRDGKAVLRFISRNSEPADFESLKSICGRFVEALS